MMKLIQCLNFNRFENSVLLQIAYLHCRDTSWMIIFIKAPYSDAFDNLFPLSENRSSEKL